MSAEHLFLAVVKITSPANRWRGHLKTKHGVNVVDFDNNANETREGKPLYFLCSYMYLLTHFLGKKDRLRLIS